MTQTPQKIINLAVLAHIDAGKTTLSERILFAAGAISHPGDVQDGLATMDYLPEEKEKGITIEAGISHFQWKNIWFNFIDAPGHIDFSAEVDTALDAIDGAILVISATSGVETQTLTAWKKLQARNIPVLLFINKLDSDHSNLDETLISIEERLEIRPLLLNFPVQQESSIGAMADVLSAKNIAHDSQGRENEITDLRGEILSRSRRLRHELAEALSLIDDKILTAQLAGKQIDTAQLVQALQQGNLTGYAPCYCGSAKDNRGVRQLLTGASLLFPAQNIKYNAALGKVIRIRYSKEHGEYAIIKCFSTIATSELNIDFKFYRIHAEMLSKVDDLVAGDIYALQSLSHKFQLGDIVAQNGETVANEAAHWEYQALLQTNLECVEAEGWESLKAALNTIQRMDPSCEIRENIHLGTWSLLTVGEVQQEVLLARLKRMFGCPIHASEPEVRYMERLKNSELCENSLEVGSHKIQVKLKVSDYEQLQEVGGFRLDYSGADLSAGQVLELDEVFQSAVQDFCGAGVRGKGEISGLEIQVLEFSASKDVPAGMIKRAFMDALKLGISTENVAVFEPYMNLEVQVPPEFAGNILGDLESKGAKIEKLGGEAQLFKIFAILPLKNVFGYSTIGRSISKGTASYALRFNGYRETM